MRQPDTHHQLAKAGFVNLGRLAWPLGDVVKAQTVGIVQHVAQWFLLNNDVLRYCSPFSFPPSLVSLSFPRALFPSLFVPFSCLASCALASYFVQFSVCPRIFFPLLVFPLFAHLCVHVCMQRKLCEVADTTHRTFRESTKEERAAKVQRNARFREKKG